MPKPLSDPHWLESLVDETLSSYDPDAARCQIPQEAKSTKTPPDVAAAARILVARSLRARRGLEDRLPPVESFTETVRDHVLLLLDLLHLKAHPPHGQRARAELAAFLAGAVGEVDLSLASSDEGSTVALERATRKALLASGKQLHQRFYPPGDPLNGLPLSSGTVAVFRRHLSRIAGGYLRKGKLDLDALLRHEQYAATELIFLAEALSGLMDSASPPDRRGQKIRSLQMSRIGLRGPLLREARHRIVTPRAPQELAVAAPEPIRGFLFEQLLLAQLRSRLPGEAPARFAEAFASIAGLDPEVIVAAQLEAAAQSGDPQAWFEGTDATTLDWHNLAEDWGAAADKVVDKVTTILTENLGALATEIRQTGELGTLLTKAASGQRLTPEEKKKVRLQLIDLAKAVPALAIFAAPGGTILLPILAKILPFNFLPSAWDKVGSSPKPQPLGLPETSAQRAPAQLDGSPKPGPEKGKKPAA